MYDEQDELAIEGTMTVVVMQDGKLVEIPPELRMALGGN